MVNIAVFASGTGSNFEAIVNHQSMVYNVVLLVCDNENAKVIKRAELLDIPTLVINPKNYKSKALYEQVICNTLTKLNIQFIVLAGYMRLIGQVLLSAYPGKIINIHPSLLPSFKGLDALGQALKAGVKMTGVTIHYVDEGMDTGKIIAQDSLLIHADESREQIEQRIHAIEHRMYPKTIEKAIKESL